MWLIQIALVLLLIGTGWSVLSRGKMSRTREALTLRRVDAYIETIRRERRNGELAAMSDSELRDLLHAGAHNFRQANLRRTWILLGAGAVTLLSAIVIASQDWLARLRDHHGDRGCGGLWAERISGPTGACAA